MRVALEFNQTDKLFNPNQSRDMLSVTFIQRNDQVKMNYLSENQSAHFTSCGFSIKNLTGSYIAFCALVVPAICDNGRSGTFSQRWPSLLR